MDLDNVTWLFLLLDEWRIFECLVKIIIKVKRFMWQSLCQKGERVGGRKGRKRILEKFLSKGPLVDYFCF